MKIEDPLKAHAHYCWHTTRDGMLLIFMSGIRFTRAYACVRVHQESSRRHSISPHTTLQYVCSCSCSCMLLLGNAFIKKKSVLQQQAKA